MPRLRRPRAVIATIAALATTAVGMTLLLSGCTEAPPVSTIGAIHFTNLLRVPPLATSTVAADGTRVFDLTANEGESHFLPGKVTPTSGYNGAYLGPTLRANDGEKVEVRVHNHLAATTTLHWHGMHLPAVADGGQILVTMSPGERVVLQSRKPELGIPGAAAGFGGPSGGSDQFDVLQLRAAATLAHVGEVPPHLVAVERLDAGAATRERTFTMDGTEINGRDMDMGRIDEVVTLGDTEIWNIRNDMGLPHSFHVHDVQFQLMDIGGAAPPPELAGWKDTIYLRPNTSYRILLKFTDYADPKHPYMYHCHLLRHEDDGMMGQFLVVEPGTKIPTTTTMENDNSHHH